MSDRPDFVNDPKRWREEGITNNNKEIDRLRAEVDSLTKANTILKQGVQDLCLRHESEVEVWKSNVDIQKREIEALKAKSESYRRCFHETEDRADSAEHSVMEQSDRIIEISARLSATKDREEALGREVEALKARGSVHDAAALLVTLKAECEKQHARAEQAEAAHNAIKIELSAASGALDMEREHLRIAEAEVAEVWKLAEDIIALDPWRRSEFDKASNRPGLLKLHLENDRRLEAENAELKNDLEAMKDRSVDEVQYIKMKEKLEREALALALECKEKTGALEAVNNYVNQALGGVESANKGDYLRACRAVRNRTKDALSRPASFWTRKAEAINAVLDAAYRIEGNYPLAWGDSPLAEALANLDSVSENK